jgi:hypothetical protein
MSVAEEAVRAVRREQSPIPLAPNSKIPPANYLWTYRQLTPPTEAQITQELEQYGSTGYAIITGAVSKLVVLDIDTDHGGRESAKALFAQHGGVPKTPTVRTPHGGHIYYRWPEGVSVKNSTGTLGDGLDVRGFGGYVVGPGSEVICDSQKHPDCPNASKPEKYEWLPGLSPEEVEYAPCPEFMLGPNQRSVEKPRTVIEDSIPEGRRNATLASAGGVMRQAGLSVDAIEAALLETNQRCDPPLGDEEVRSIARSIGRYDPGEMLSSAGGVAPKERKLVWHTGDEEEDLSEPEYVIKHFIVEGSTIEFSGKIKEAGKTTVMMSVAKAVVTGTPFLGYATKKTPVVYLTESPKTSFREARRRAGLIGEKDFHYIHWHETFGTKWADVAEQAVSKALELGALLIIDTMFQFASIRGDGENSSGEALEAMQPLQMAAGLGLTIIVVRHSKKGMGSGIADDARGSSAFGGAVDTLMKLTRVLGSTNLNVRAIESISRFDGIKPDIRIELTETGWVLLGESRDVIRQEERDFLLESLPFGEAEAMSREEIKTDTELGKTKIVDFLNELKALGLVVQTGGGVKGSSLKYYRADDSFLPIKGGSPERMNPDDDELFG